jgi:ABC-type glycerol-3-phosphate transport system substrate-binding protein
MGPRVALAAALGAALVIAGCGARPAPGDRSNPVGTPDGSPASSVTTTTFATSPPPTHPPPPPRGVWG